MRVLFLIVALFALIAWDVTQNDGRLVQKANGFVHELMAGN
jgi:hypothetical protein